MPDIVKEKLCTKCGVLKDRSDFYTNSSRCSGLATWCKACDLAAKKERYKQDPTQIKARSAQWRSDPANREKARLTSAAWRAANPDRKSLGSAAWYARNREACIARQTAWAKNHPRAVSEIGKRRYRRKKDAFVEVVDRVVVFERDRGICGICKTAVGARWTIDHIQPLSRGGKDCYSNVQLAHPACNFSKHDKAPLT